MGSLNTDDERFANPPDRRMSLDRPSARQPPRWAAWLLSHCCPAGLEDELQGDLLEMYTYWLKTLGVSKARWRYTLAVLRLIRPFTKSKISQTTKYTPSIRFAMVPNYLKIAFRNLARNKVYSFINMAGLSLGLACTMLIILYVKDETSFDRFHKNATHIFRVASKTTGATILETGLSGYLEGPRFSRNVPGIQSFVRIKSRMEDIQRGTEVDEQNTLLVDAAFFSIFSFPLISGDEKTCLTHSNSVVLSEHAAEKQFGTIDAVGKIVMIKRDSIFVPYKVTAVAKNCPQNSSIQFDVVLPINASAADENDNTNWYNAYLNTFVALDDNVDSKTVEQQMQRFYLQDSKAIYNEVKKKMPGFDRGVYFLQPLLNIHLSNNLPATNSLSNAGSPVYSYILSAIALFVLLIACINFVNLTMARSIKRAKEIGVRKVMGSGRSQLMIQFMGESFLLCTVAFSMAVLLAWSLLPLFNELANKALSISYLFDIKLITTYVALYAGTSLLAGFYPALILSGYNPMQTLNNRFQVAGKNYLQKVLVVLQFTLASFLIIATLAIYAQVNLLTKTDLGYDDANLVVINKHRLQQADAAVFKDALVKNSNIVGVSVKNAGTMQVNAKVAGESTIHFQYETIDENYLPLLKIPFVVGKNFTPGSASDSMQSVIVNESFAKAANWKAPVGETVNFNTKKYRVIGVVKDYHFASMTEKITPQLFSLNKDNLYGVYYVRIKANTATTSLQWIQQVVQQFYPLDPYSYLFKNEANRQQYAAIEKWKQILLFGASLTVLISCFGLFGLSVLAAEKRVKEIGIRKVLGATVGSLVTSLSTDFMKLVMWALLIASPLAHLAVNTWLKNFPYRITISWWLFALTGIVVMLIALITISFQSIRAALTNPVNALRRD